MLEEQVIDGRSSLAARHRHRPAGQEAYQRGQEVYRRGLAADRTAFRSWTVRRASSATFRMMTSQSTRQRCAAPPRATALAATLSAFAVEFALQVRDTH